jgi:uncharacterized protein YndB with AHSA1/START domain
MPVIKRSAVIDAPPKQVWRLISDPANLPRWWPRVLRVEAVEKTAKYERSQWTKVLGTREGRGIRADYRCTAATNERRYVWRQELEGSPFERHLSSAETEILLEPEGDEATAVTIISRQKLRGLSRLGDPMMRGAGRRLVDEALQNLAAALEPAG